MTPGVARSACGTLDRVTANVAELLTRAAKTAPDRPALVESSGGAVMTWAQLDDAVSRMAEGLGREGLVAGNRVVIATANRPEFVIAYLAVLRARLVAVPVNPRSAAGELLRTLTDSGARLVVADGTTVDGLRGVLAGITDALAAGDQAAVDQAAVDQAVDQAAVDQAAPAPVRPRLVVADSPTHDGELSFDDLLVSSAGELFQHRDPESLAVLLYTSGTSARPRAAMLTHRALLANIDQVAAVEPPLVRGDDVVFGVLPLFHVYGLNAVLGQVLHACATLVVADSFDPIGSIAEIEQHGVSVVPIAPAVLAHWRTVPDLASRLAAVRTILSGSAPLSAELVTELADAGVVVQQGYGLTEAAPVVTSTLASATVPGADAGVPKPASVGAALPGVSLRLVDDTGSEPAPGDPGEILVKGDNLFEGYWPDAEDGPVDGWFATGDVGIIDGDGDLFLVDRLKELVIVSGFNVYPTEVEEVLCEVDGVLEAAVVGVPDDVTGEAVHAYVRAASGDPAELDDLRHRLRDACDQRLARFKQPSRLEFVTELPRTVTGKVAKGRLRSTIRREHLELLE